MNFKIDHMKKNETEIISIILGFGFILLLMTIIFLFVNFLIDFVK